MADWQDLIRGEPMRNKWRAGHVLIGGVPTLAHSQGPYVLDRVAADGGHEFLIGRYQSIWLREGDGQWRVLFDGAGGAPKAVSADEANAWLAQAPERCE